MCKNSLAIHDTNLDLLTITEEVKNILEILEKVLAKINSPRTLFTQGNDLDPVELAMGKETHTETPMEDGKMTPLLTHPPYQSPTPVDAPDAPDSPLPLPR